MLLHVISISREKRARSCTQLHAWIMIKRALVVAAFAGTAAAFHYPPLLASSARTSSRLAPQRIVLFDDQPGTQVEELQARDALLQDEACIIADPEADEALWPWRLLLLAIAVAWGANFAVVKLAIDAMGSSAEAVTLFTAARFTIGAALLSPALLTTSSSEVVAAGLSVGSLTTFGYVAQSASLAMGTLPGTAGFICSLNAVVVALMVGQRTGCVSPRTWWAVGISVLGVGCLELPGALASGIGGLCLGDLVAFGQPLGFGASCESRASKLWPSLASSPGGQAMPPFL